MYPLYTVVLAAFAHVQAGEAGAVEVLRGLLLGLYAFVAFYLLAAALLPRATITDAFAAAEARPERDADMSEPVVHVDAPEERLARQLACGALHHREAGGFLVRLADPVGGRSRVGWKRQPRP